MLSSAFRSICVVFLASQPEFRRFLCGTRIASLRFACELRKGRETVARSGASSSPRMRQSSPIGSTSGTKGRRVWRESPVAVLGVAGKPQRRKPAPSRPVRPDGKCWHTGERTRWISPISLKVNGCFRKFTLGMLLQHGAGLCVRPGRY